MRIQPNIRLLSEIAEAIANVPFPEMKANMPNAIPAKTSANITKVRKVSAVFDLSLVDLSIKNACQLILTGMDSQLKSIASLDGNSTPYVGVSRFRFEEFSYFS